MKSISQSVVKADHASKIRGESLFVSDFSFAEDGRAILCGKMLRSSKAKAKVKEVNLPPMPEGCFYVDASDIPGDNNVNIVEDDCPVFSRGNVEFIGEAIGMVVAPTEAQAQSILNAITVEYEELEPNLDFRNSPEIMYDISFGHGNTEEAFALADRVFEEEFETGYQEQAYLETQGILAEPDANGGIFVHGSMQCCYYPNGILPRVLNLPKEKIHVRQDVTGGGFGGKEDYPSILCAQVAVAALKAKAPVRCVLERREDMMSTSKRHPSICRYKASVKNGKLTAMDIDVKLNGGAYTTLSLLVLNRALAAANGVYDVPNLHIRGRVIKTNTVPCGAYRGFGGPQVFFAVEMLMDHIAKALGVPSLQLKEGNLAHQGDWTSTCGIYHFPVPLPGMIRKVDEMCDYRKKAEIYSRPQTGRLRRGIGLSLFFHGAGLGGADTEKQAIHPAVRLHKYEDDRVEILASAGEIGQGVRTTLTKIAAHVLEIPLEQVFLQHPDTARVPDSGPTVASRTIMVVGEMVRRGALQLKAEWKSGTVQEVEERYTQPDYVIPFDSKTHTGDNCPTYSWGVNAVEVELDTLTGQSKVLGAYGCFDAGTPIDRNILQGQFEGGFLQGLGYASSERMNYNEKGYIRNNNFADYLIPTAKDIPNMQCAIYEEEYPDGPFGAKGAGELPLVGAAPAYAEAVEMAMGGTHPVRYVPFSQQDALMALTEDK